MRILLADDSIEEQFLVRELLRGTSHCIEAVDDGQIAVELFRSRRFDAVLVSVDLPILDGHSTVRMIRQWETDNGLVRVPIIALLPYGSKSGSETQAAGCSGFLIRPIQKEALFDCLERQHWSDLLSQWSGRSSQDRNKRISVTVSPELKELVPGFLEHRRKDLLELREALKAQDFETVRLLGLRLKGKGSGYGFAGISAIGDALERAALAKNVLDIRDAIAELNAYLDRLDVVC